MTSHLLSLRRLLATLAAASALLAIPAGAQAAPWPANPNWQSYVEAPSSRIFYPVAIAGTTGDVTDAAALTSPNSGGSVTLTYAPGGTAPTITLDYGRDTGGLPQFDVADVSGPVELDAAYSETRAYLSSTGDIAGTPGLFLSGDPARVQPEIVTGPGVISDRLIQGGERYEMITLETPGTLRLRSADIDFTGFLGTPSNLRGHFVSSSPLLNRIWYAGVYTVNLDQLSPGTPSNIPGETNSIPVLIDGATRDRGVWAGDLGISGQTVFYALDPSYVRGSIERLGQHPGTAATFLAPSVGSTAVPGPMPGACTPIDNGACVFWGASYSMLFVDDLYRYYLYAGDLAFVRQEWPNVTRELAWDAEQVDSSGLFSTSEADGDDWNTDIHSGDFTYNNALYYEVLEDGAAMADALGDRADASTYRSRAEALRTAANAKLFNAAAGLYEPSTSETGTVQDANVYAILSGLAPQADWANILSVLDPSLATSYGMLNVASPAPSGYTQLISPYMSGYQLEAEFEAGRTDEALAMIETEWGWMIDHDPGGTVWEKYTANGTTGSSFTSMAHAWGSGATSALSRFVLGVAPTAPGFRTLMIQPHPGDLTWAEGTVPTPEGTVTVNWGRAAGGAFCLQVRTPKRTLTTIAVPRGVDDTVSLNGHVVWDPSGFHKLRGVAGATQDGSYIYFNGVAPGEWTASSR